tara:strand:+ start:986 stop:2137 length:1152 start_codon:yes stop_codon:yes gene_type:complete
MPRFLGSRYGDVVNATETGPQLSGVFDLNGWTYVIKRGGGTEPKPYWEFKVWGGGGGGGPNGAGGGGAYVTGQYQIEEGSTITLVVGAGGRGKSVSGDPNSTGINMGMYGGGGPRGTQYNYNTGLGGGLSGVFLTSNPCYTTADSPTPAGLLNPRTGGAPTRNPGVTEANALLLAGAGGGGGYEPGIDCYGGAGGVTAGGAGAPVPQSNGASTGGTWDGSTGGTAGESAPTDPGSVDAGFGYGGNTSGGGGGGSGWRGGGAGGNASKVGNGSGGASYWKGPTHPAPPIYDGWNPGTQAGNDGSPGAAPGPTPGAAGNWTDPVNGSTYGRGGPAPQPTVPTYTNDAQHGMIAYRRASSYAGLPAEAWTVVTMDGADHQVSTDPS